MFGYIRPFRPELKCKDLDLYQATYCGLCCTLRERYGLLAPMFLSYDLTFLALLLEDEEEQYSTCRGRCHGNMFLKKRRVQTSEALRRCADITVILAWFQLQDSIADDTFWKKSFSFVLSIFMKPSYRKASQHLGEFVERTKSSLVHLAKLEKESCSSMDEVADCFAVILRETVPKEFSEVRIRCLHQILYHVGRWIYLVDAKDDFLDDCKTGNYNPLIYRYGEEIEQESLDITLSHSLYLASTSLDFLDFGVRAGLIENIIQMGMPVVQKAVLENTWNKEKNTKIWSKSR